MSKFEVLPKDEVTDAVYGCEEYELTISDIAELLTGNTLISTINDEYVITIKLQEEKRK